jgi:YggT family protein
VDVGGSVLAAVLEILLILLTMIQWLVIAAALVSWVSPDPRNPIVQFLYRMTEPLLRPFRRILPPSRTGGIDLSPLFVILLVVFLKIVLSRLFLTPRLA